jgi:16S rRNA (cytosine1402-N4)-methyltransferase
MIYHRPVLLEESINGLNIKPEGIFVDLTFGGGGHASGILKELGKKGKLLAFDQDTDARRNITDDPRFIFINSNFRYLRNFLRYYKVERIDGVMADLGISSHQIDTAERGFSFMKDAKLDMRMNSGILISAADLLNHYEEEELNRVFRQYGELSNSGALSKAIIKLRTRKEIESIPQFIEGISHLLPRQKENRELAKIFQALRIEVNDEMGALKDVLPQINDFLNPGGRMVFLTYHSLEDRLVKNYMKTGNLDGVLNKDFYGNILTPFKIINKNGTEPSEEEVRNNPRARSARLRIAEKL